MPDLPEAIAEAKRLPELADEIVHDIERHERLQRPRRN